MLRKKSTIQWQRGKPRTTSWSERKSLSSISSFPVDGESSGKVRGSACADEVFLNLHRVYVVRSEKPRDHFTHDALGGSDPFKTINSVSPLIELIWWVSLRANWSSSVQVHRPLVVINPVPSVLEDGTNLKKALNKRSPNVFRSFWCHDWQLSPEWAEHVSS